MSGDLYRPGDYGRDGRDDSRRNDTRYADSRYGPTPSTRNYNNIPYDAPGQYRPQYAPPAHYDSYAPPPPPPRDAYYQPSHPRDPGPPPPPPATLNHAPGMDPRSSRQGGYDDRGSRNGGQGYSFMGAAGGQSSGSDFTFRAQGQPTPHFPPASTGDPNRYPKRDYRPPHRGGPPTGQRGRRPARGGGFRGRGGFKLPKASDRQILHDTNRATTPEQMEGMNGMNQPRFNENVEDSSDGEASMDISDDDDEEEEEVVERGADDAPSKRRKVAHSDGEQVPKWSNPDPYTSIPPPDTLGAPKKDIVQVIRKAKNETGQASGGNAVSQNVDFISFNDDEEEEDDDDEEADDPFQVPTTYEPQGKSSGPMGARNDMRPFESDFSKMDHNDIIDADDGYGKGGAGKKRKRGKEPRLATDIVGEWQAGRHDNAAPWCKKDQSSNTESAQRLVSTPMDTLLNLLTLHHRLNHEIMEFWDYVKPLAHEDSIRRDLIKRVEHHVQRFPGARDVEVLSFGSFAAGLYLPTADMDLVAVSKGFMQRGHKTFCESRSSKFRLSGHLQQNSRIVTPGTMVTIPNSRVPLVKFVDQDTGIKIDISFENDSGLVTNHTFAQWKQEFPEMPILVVLIKQLLAMRGRDEVFSGGLGGFSVICLVVSMLQLMPERQSGAMRGEEHLGYLLMSFLDLYGNRFDICEVGIRMNPPGYFNKATDPAPRQRMDGLTIVDPNRADNDISGGSRDVKAVFDIFRDAHYAIMKRLDEISRGEEVGESILACMWGGNYAVFAQQRKKLYSIAKDMNLSTVDQSVSASPPPPPPPPPPVAQTSQPEPKGKRRRPKKSEKKAKAAPQANSQQNGSNAPTQSGLKQTQKPESSGDTQAYPRLSGKKRMKAKQRLRAEFKWKAEVNGEKPTKAKVNEWVKKELHTRHGPG